MSIRANLHVHSQRSDGSFSIEDIVHEAIRGGLDAVAITDHFETQKVRRCVTSESIDDYLLEIREAQRKADGGIKVLAGVEVDTNPERCHLSSLPVEKLNQLDLVLFEYVNDDWNGGCSVFELDALLSQLSVPCGLVHTDLEKVFGGISPDDLANLLQSYGLFVEANTAVLYARNGVQYYELAERHFRAFKGKVRVSVGTDAHRTLAEVSNVGKGYQFLERLQLLDDQVLR
ncbi:MAG: PHP domain-containing protein [Methanomassiliicoccales archaeon]|nr:PHP domain-containing protein [Methanomassiliicoccales archaeon]